MCNEVSGDVVVVGTGLMVAWLKVSNQPLSTGDCL